MAYGENVQDQLGVIQAEPETQFYTVVSSGTPSRVAKQFYGNVNAYKVFFEANKPMLSS